MLRRLALNLLSFISLLLFLSTTTLFIRSFWIRDIWFQSTSEMISVTSIQSNRGSLWLFLSNPRFLLNRGSTNVKWNWWSSPVMMVDDPLGSGAVLGFAHQSLAWSSGTITVFPHWSLILLTSILPGIRLISYIRRRRASKNPTACPTCGYDLRGTPTCCPECGAISPLPAR